MAMQELQLRSGPEVGPDRLLTELLKLEEDLVRIIGIYDQAWKEHDLTFIRMIRDRYQALLEDVKRLKDLTGETPENRGVGGFGR